MLPVEEAQEPLDTLLSRLRFAPIEPLALELLSPALAARLGIASDSRAALLVRLGGNEESVRSQRDYLHTFTEPLTAPAGVWQALSECEPSSSSPRGATARFSAAPSRMAHTWSVARAAAGGSPHDLVHATVARGVARCMVGGDDASGERLIAAAARFAGTVIFERLPAGLWPRTRGGSASGESGTSRIARGIKLRFDPANVLNPGIMGELHG
jgi:FAD/FMN-containing dehydrogenase